MSKRKAVVGWVILESIMSFEHMNTVTKPVAIITTSEEDAADYAVKYQRKNRVVEAWEYKVTYQAVKTNPHK